MSSKQDAELIAALRAGDRKAGQVLVERYYPKVLNFCRSKAPSAANDIAQKSFLGVFERLDKLRDPANFRGFLFGVVCNQVRMHYRRNRVEGERLDFGTVTSMDLDPSPSRIMTEKAEHRVLLEGLRRIPLEYQMVLELHYWENMRGQDIAEALDLPLGTVKTRIRRGRQLLEAAITEVEAPGQLLESTKTNLDDWARGLRKSIDTPA